MLQKALILVMILSAAPLNGQNWSDRPNTAELTATHEFIAAETPASALENVFPGDIQEFSFKTPFTFSLPASLSLTAALTATNEPILELTGPGPGFEALLVVNADGNVGVGTALPSTDAMLHVVGSGNTQFHLESSTGGPLQLRLRTDLSTNRVIVATNTDNSTIHSQLNFGDDGNFTFLGQDSSDAVCLQFRDSDDAGNTKCTFLNGAINCSIGTCP